MPKFEVSVIVTCRDYVIVETDTLIEAERLVCNPDFNADDALAWNHDTSPEIKLASAGARPLED